MDETKIIKFAVVTEQWQMDLFLDALENATEEDSIVAEVLYNRAGDYVIGRPITCKAKSVKITGYGNNKPGLTFKGDAKLEFTNIDDFDMSDTRINNDVNASTLISITGKTITGSIAKLINVDFANIGDDTQCVLFSNLYDVYVHGGMFNHNISSIGRSVITHNVHRTKLDSVFHTGGENLLYLKEDADMLVGGGYYTVYDCSVFDVGTPVYCDVATAAYAPTVFISTNLTLMQVGRSCINSNGHICASFEKCTLATIGNVADTLLVNAPIDQEVKVFMNNVMCKLPVLTSGHQNASIWATNSTIDIDTTRVGNQVAIDVGGGYILIDKCRLFTNNSTFMFINNATIAQITDSLMEFVNETEDDYRNGINSKTFVCNNNRIKLSPNTELVFSGGSAVVLNNSIRSLDSDSPISDPVQFGECDGYSVTGNRLDGGEYNYGR